MSFWQNLKWRCHVCGKERPDDKISVLSKPISHPDGRIIGEQSIRYCNDDPSCVAEARNVDFLYEQRRAT